MEGISSQLISTTELGKTLILTETTGESFMKSHACNLYLYNTGLIITDNPLASEKQKVQIDARIDDIIGANVKKNNKDRKNSIKHELEIVLFRKNNKDKYCRNANERRMDLVTVSFVTLETAHLWERAINRTSAKLPLYEVSSHIYLWQRNELISFLLFI